MILINVILIALIVFFLASAINNVAANQQKQEPIKPTCPPHSWQYEKVYNEDGSVHHEYLVCKKCGPLHGVKEDE